MTAAAAPPREPAEQTLREVRRGVAAARDAQILQVVQMVDALENRGAADAVLEPVRPRLRAMQPARPLRFSRLLFMPMDLMIVAPREWQPGSPFLPRTALTVLTATVRHVATPSGPQAARLARIDELIAGATTAQSDTARLAGGLLWPYASVVLRQLSAAKDTSALLAACLSAWAAKGLARAELRPVAAGLAHILSHAACLHDHDCAAPALTQAAVLDMLAGADAAGPRACGMVLSLLVLRVPEHAALLLEAARRSPVAQLVADSALDSALAWAETAAQKAGQTGGIGDADAEAVARQTALLEGLADQCGSTRKRRLTEIRSRLLAGCLDRYETSLQAQLTAPLQALPADPASRGVSLDAMEATARTLRRFEMEARRLGAGSRFDSLAQRTAASVTQAASLSGMDRARLVEILMGGEAARRVLQ